MKKIIITLLTLAVVLTACQESLEERCDREAKDFTKKHCPLPIDKDVVMDSMTFDKATHTINYIYTLSGAIDNEEIMKKADPRKLLLGELKNSTNLKLYKEAGYNFRYTYYSTHKKGTKLFEATFREKDYR